MHIYVNMYVYIRKDVCIYIMYTYVHTYIYIHHRYIFMTSIRRARRCFRQSATAFGMFIPAKKRGTLPENPTIPSC